MKQSENIGRNVVDNFETAIRRMGKKNGVIVGFSFGSTAFGEVARALFRKVSHGLVLGITNKFTVSSRE